MASKQETKLSPRNTTISYEPLISRRPYQSVAGPDAAGEAGLHLSDPRRGAGDARRQDVERAARRGVAQPVAAHQLHQGEPQQGGAFLGAEHRERGAGHAQYPHGGRLPERQRGGV